jgi:glycine oxidase
VTVDVLIVGAGIIGCAVAEALTWRGARVQVVDPRGVGDGATQASAGMLAPHSEGRHDAWLASLGVRSMAAYDALLERLAPADAAGPLVARPGSLELALSDAEAADLRHCADELQAAGVECAFLPAAAARALEPAVAPECRGALHVPGHGYARASMLTRCLWDASARRGAQLTRAAVHSIDPNPTGGVRVRAGDRDLSAGAVVVAAGSWAAAIRIGALDPLPIRPIRGQLLQLAWPDAAPSHIIGGTRCYSLAWPDGTMLAGATVEDVGFDDRATAGGIGELLEALRALVPASANATFTGVRVGFRPMTPDARPMIGRSSRIPGLVYAVGHYRNGVLLAPVTGELVVKALAGEEDEAFAGCDTQRFGEY